MSTSLFSAVGVERNNLQRLLAVAKEPGKDTAARPLVPRWQTIYKSWRSGYRLPASASIVGSLLLPIIVFIAGGCARAQHTNNVNPGDADYPIVNPNPRSVIKLTVIIANRITVQLYQGYAAHRGGGSVEAGPPCAYIQTLSQARIPYSVNLDLQLPRSTEDAMSGEISLDRYLSGSCKWGFAGAWYVDENAQNPDELLVAHDFDYPVVNARVDLWCVRSPKRNPTIVQACLDIEALETQFPEQISEITVKTIVANGGGKGTPFAVSRGVQSLVIQFHDLDAADTFLRDDQSAQKESHDADYYPRVTERPAGRRDRADWLDSAAAPCSPI